MSDGGDAFLARWSRRKSQAHAETKPDHACGEGQKQPEATAEAGATAGDPAREPADDQEEIALEDLPPIDSIDASTDLAFWLRQKVPDAWKQAVLSRAWAADPAISQFVGLAENSWDWNVPGGVPGFGPLSPTANMAQLLAQAIGQVAAGSADAIGEAVASEMARAESGSAESQPAMPKKQTNEVPLESVISGPGPAESRADAAKVKEPQIVKRRRGGGALPS